MTDRITYELLIDGQPEAEVTGEAQEALAEMMRYYRQYIGECKESIVIDQVIKIEILREGKP